MSSRRERPARRNEDGCPGVTTTEGCGPGVMPGTLEEVCPGVKPCSSCWTASLPCAEPGDDLPWFTALSIICWHAAGSEVVAQIPSALSFAWATPGRQPSQRRDATVHRERRHLRRLADRDRAAGTAKTATYPTRGRANIVIAARADGDHGRKPRHRRTGRRESTHPPRRARKLCVYADAPCTRNTEQVLQKWICPDYFPHPICIIQHSGWRVKRLKKGRPAV